VTPTSIPRKGGQGVRVGRRCAGSYRARSYPDRARESSPTEVGLKSPARSGWRPERAAPFGRHISGAHGRRSSSLAGSFDKRPLRAVTDFSHAARRNGTKATPVKNEGAFPPADARTYCPEEGSDDDTFDATSRRRGGGLPRLKDIG